MTEQKQTGVELSGIFIYACTIIIRMARVNDSDNWQAILLLHPVDETILYT